LADWTTLFTHPYILAYASGHQTQLFPCIQATVIVAFQFEENASSVVHRLRCAVLGL